VSNDLIVIEARPTSIVGRFRDAWKYRRYYPILLKEITMRKFRNTVLGFWWLIIRPLIPVVIAIVTFTYFIEMDTGDLPYGIFFMAGFIVWNVVESTLQFMARTMMWTRNIMKKMYLPKLLIPFASIGPPAIELGIVIIAFFVLLGYYYYTVDIFYLQWDIGLLLFPVCVFLAAALSIAIGSVIAMVALVMRDIIYSVRYVMQLIMFITPVIYPLSAVPEDVQWVFIALNPMTGVIETSRWALTGFESFDPILLLISVIQITLICLLCLTFFSRADSYLSDIV